MRGRAFIVLLALDVLYRLPGLLHTKDVNSDAAVVALQAMHLLQGEFARILWGAQYQGTLEPMVAAVFFVIGGPTPLMLSLSTLLAHFVILFFAWRVLLRRLEPAKAFALSLLLVFTPQAINGMVWVPQPRIWCIAVVFVAIFLVELATPLALAAGMFVGMLSIWADVFGMQLMIPVLIFACMCVSSRRHAVAIALGLGAGIIAVVQLRVGTRVFAGPGSLGLAHLERNWALLTDHCLPMILGVQVWDPEPWTPPAAWHVWQLVGAIVFSLAIAAAGPLALAKRLPWELRRLGLLGAGTALAALLGFLVSSMPGDLWAARYLTAIVWLAPFALAPLAATFTLRGLCVAVLVPYLSVAAVSGLRGWSWKRLSLPRGADEEAELAAFLRAEHIRYAAAHYWLSYRLTFLFREEPIVTPLEGTRYKPYREAFDREERVAYLTHPSVPDVTGDELLARLQQQKGTVKTATVAGFTVLIHDRR